jgi:hypothetical protein
MRVLRRRLARVVYQTKGHSITELIEACQAELENLFLKRERPKMAIA